MKRTATALVWKELCISNTMTFVQIGDLLTHISALSPRRAVVWEVRGSGGKIRLLIGTGRRYWRALQSAFSSHGKPDFLPISEEIRTETTHTKRLKMRKTAPLNPQNTALAMRTTLAAMEKTSTNETLTLQMILGQSTPETHGFFTQIRIGSNAETNKRAHALLLSLISALRLLETKGVDLHFCATCPAQFNNATVPLFMPNQFTASELVAFTLLPCVEAVGEKHPKILPAPSWVSNIKDRCFARSLGAKSVYLNIFPQDALEHTVVLGPTGSGKSTLLLNLALADMGAGRGVLLIDPKGDLVNDCLARIPESRTNDVVVIDPTDACPVGVNPFLLGDQTAPNLVCDTILATFQQLYADAWGIYTQDILSAALLTLAYAKNATLLDISELLINPHFRNKITVKLPAHIASFWTEFDALSKPEQRQRIAPVMNKLRQFTMRPALRNVLGQAMPKFHFSDLFDQQKIVLVPLNKGIVGAETARLLGSLIVGMTWTLALGRAALEPEKRNFTSVFIDELQDYLALPCDFADALAQARGLGVGFTVAHQYRAQLSLAMKAALDANARNKICFALNSASARDMAAMATDLNVEDFQSLPRYEIYANLQHCGRNTGWISAKTKQAPPILRLPLELKAQSQKNYGGTPEKTVNHRSVLPVIEGEIGKKKMT